MPIDSKSQLLRRCVAFWVATTLSLLVVDAHAQEAGAPSPAPAPTATTATTPTEPVIAPPGPAAPPERVEKVKAQAKEAELTPIVPSPKDPTRPAFQLYAESDLPILGVGLVFASVRLVRSQTPYCAPLRDPSDLNAFDRVTAGNWNPTWSTMSDIGLYSLAAGAAVVLIADEGLLELDYCDDRDPLRTQRRALVYLIVDPVSIAVPVPHLQGVPLLYPQYRATVGLELYAG